MKNKKTETGMEFVETTGVVTSEKILSNEVGMIPKPKSLGKPWFYFKPKKAAHKSRKTLKKVIIGSVATSGAILLGMFALSGMNFNKTPVEINPRESFVESSIEASKNSDSEISNVEETVETSTEVEEVETNSVVEISKAEPKVEEVEKTSTIKVITTQVKEVSTTPVKEVSNQEETETSRNLKSDEIVVKTENSYSNSATTYALTKARDEVAKQEAKVEAEIKKAENAKAKENEKLETTKTEETKKPENSKVETSTKAEEQTSIPTAQEASEIEENTELEETSYDLSLFD